MKTSHFLKYCLGIVSFLCLCACQPDTVFYTYNPVAVNGWNKMDTLQFYLPDTLTPGTYNLEVGIRHSGKYPYRDLWLELTQYLPNMKVANDWIEHKDTIHIYLANEKGNWEGTGTTGGHFQLLSPSGTITLKEDSHWKELTVTDSVKTTNTNVLLPNKKKKKYTFEGKPHTLGRMAKHHLKIVHIMTDSVLYHVSDVGIRLTGPVQHP